VAGPPIVTEAEQAFLRQLVKQKVAFLIVGLSSAALQGAPAVTQDIDLWFADLGDPGLKRALEKVGAVYVPPIGLNPPMFAGKGMGLFDIVLRMDGLRSFEQEARRALEVRLGGVKVKLLPLDRIIASKRAANRPKDRLVIPVLESALAAVRDRRSRAPRGRRGKKRM
jgi:hypothetical protein